MNMDNEQETKEEAKPTEATPTEAGGNEEAKESPNLVDGAVAAAKALKTENDRKEALMKKQEEQDARRALGGITEAGSRQAKAKETDEEYAERFRKGEVNPLEDDVNKSKTE